MSKETLTKKLFVISYIFNIIVTCHASHI
jgi:hypothetical protein